MMTLEGIVCTQWLVDYPNFRRNPLYISGDSYAGMIVPIVVQEILTGNYSIQMPILSYNVHPLNLHELALDFNLG